MGNMSYCRFENTFKDLDDCYEALANGDLPDSESETKYINKLIGLCRDIADDIKEDLCL